MERSAWFVLAMVLWCPGELAVAYSLSVAPSLPNFLAGVATWAMAFWAVEMGLEAKRK